MTNYLGNQDSFSQGGTNGGYVPSAGGDSVNPLIKDIVPDVDIMRDIGQPLKRIKTGYYSRLDVTNSDPPVLGLAIQAALSAGGFLLQDESAGFGFTPLKELTITRIFIQKSILPALPVARTVKIWQEPGTLLHTGIISNVNDDGLNWYTDVNWIVPANVAIRYATDVPNGTSIHVSPAAAFSPVFVDFIQSVAGTGYGVYPASGGLYPSVPLGNFRFTTEPDTAITYNGTPVALLTDLTSGDISLTALQTKTQYQSIPGPNITGFTDLYASGEFTVQGNSGVGNLLVQGELRCDQKQAIFEAGVDVVGSISADNLDLPGFPDVDATLTAYGNAITSQANHLNLTNIGTNTHAQIDSNLTSLNTSVGTLQGKTQNIMATSGTTTLTGNAVVTGNAEVKANHIVRGALQVDGAATVGGFPVATSTEIGILNAKTQNITASAGTTVFTGSTTGLNHLNLSNIGTNTHAQIDTNLGTLNTKTQNITAVAGTTSLVGNLQMGGTFVNQFNGNAYDHSLANNIFLGDTFSSGAFWAQLLKSPTQTTLKLGQGSSTSTNIELFGVSNTINYQIENTAGTLRFMRNFTPFITYDGTTNLLTPGIRGLYVGPGVRPVVSSGFVQTAAGAPVFNTTTAGALLGTGTGTLNIGANTMVSGSLSKFTAGGIIQTSGNNQQITMRLRNTSGPGFTWGDLVYTIQQTLPANSAWQLETLMTIQGTGVTAPAVVNMKFMVGAESFMDIQNITVDTTQLSTVNISAQWATANAANFIQCTQSLATNYYQPTA